MAGTLDFSPTLNNAGLVNKIILPWTSDGSGNASVTSDLIRGVILRVTTNPGTPAPTDNYDIALADEDGVSIIAADGLGLNRDTVNSESVCPVDGISGLPFAVCGPLTLTVSGAGSAKQGTVVIYFR